MAVKDIKNMQDMEEFFRTFDPSSIFTDFMSSVINAFNDGGILGNEKVERLGYSTSYRGQKAKGIHYFNFYKKLDDFWSKTLTVSFREFEPGLIRITPFVGIGSIPIEFLVYDLARDVFLQKRNHATVKIALPSLLSQLCETPPTQWVIDSISQLDDVFVEITAQVQNYGEPYLDKHLNLEAILSWLLADEKNDNFSPPHCRIAACYYFLGRDMVARDYLKAKLDQFPRQSGMKPTPAQRFAETFLKTFKALR